MLINTIIKSAS